MAILNRTPANQATSNQATDTVLMIRPAAFGFNAETAVSNRMQKTSRLDPALAAREALAEFDAMVHALEGAGVRVCVVDDTLQPVKPDAVFPNNWVSFHADGTVCLYPMQAPSRRAERRRDVVDAVVARTGFVVTRTVDLTRHEAHGHFLEGTGSLVLDHVARVAYACRSPRTDESVLREWARELAFEVVNFDATDAQGVPYYHTNVMLSIGSRSAVVALETIAATDRDRVAASLAASGREVIAIDRRDVAHFAGNALELAAWDEALGDCRVLVLSASARASLPPQTFARLAACVDDVVVVPVPTIEALGGGSVRCMLAEVFTA